MRKELYDKIFARMDELGAIRKDLTFGCLVSHKIDRDIDGGKYIGHYIGCNQDSIYRIVKEDGDILFTLYHDSEINDLEIIGHHIVLSDCLNVAYSAGEKYAEETIISGPSSCWNLDIPYLKDQSDEAGETFFKLIMQKS